MTMVNTFIAIAGGALLAFCYIGFKMYKLNKNSDQVARMLEKRQKSRRFSINKLIGGSYNYADLKQHNQGVPPEDPCLLSDKTYDETPNIQMLVRAELRGLGGSDDGEFYNY